MTTSSQKDLIWEEVESKSFLIPIIYFIISNDEDKFAKEIMYTKIEEKDWKIECGRALSHLKIRDRKRHSGKEWRNHIEKTK